MQCFAKIITDKLSTIIDIWCCGNSVHSTVVSWLVSFYRLLSTLPLLRLLALVSFCLVLNSLLIYFIIDLILLTTWLRFLVLACLLIGFDVNFLSCFIFYIFYIYIRFISSWSLW